VTYAIVPAGGLGARMGSRRPKQYLRLRSVPILVATLRALAGARSLDGIVVAVPSAHVEATRRLLARRRVPKILDVVAGGADRQESVWRALLRIPEDARSIVVHDAVRPFITAALVERVLAAAAGGAATCGVPVRETVKRVREGAVEATVDRIGAERHPLSGIAKELGSAAVFMSFVLLAASWALLMLDRLPGP